MNTATHHPLAQSLLDIAHGMNATANQATLRAAAELIDRLSPAAKRTMTRKASSSAVDIENLCDEIELQHAQEAERLRRGGIQFNWPTPEEFDKGDHT